MENNTNTVINTHQLFFGFHPNDSYSRYISTNDAKNLVDQKASFKVTFFFLIKVVQLFSANFFQHKHCCYLRFQKYKDWDDRLTKNYVATKL